MSTFALARRSWCPLLATAASLCLLAGCSREPAAAGAAPAASSASAPAPAAAPAGPPVSVRTVRAAQRDFNLTLETTGTVTAIASVDVKAQASSVVTAVHVREGQFVKKGQALFTLDVRADEANTAKLRAQLARDQAALADAQRQLKRSRELLAMNYVSQAAVDANQTLVDSQLAAVGASRAALDAARVVLSYGQIVAPASGRVGVVAAQVGAAVVANQTPLLTITQLTPIDVAFAVTQRDLPDVLAALRGAAQGAPTPVTARLPDATGASAQATGVLNFVDSAVDAASGTVKAKARFDNPGAVLWPGAFVKVSLVLRTLKDAVVIPQSAVIESPRGPMVYAVAGGKAVARPLEVLASRGDDAAVRGVSAGEAIVTDGRQNLRPGVPVAERGRDGSGPGAASGPASGGAAGAGPGPGGAIAEARRANAAGSAP